MVASTVTYQQLREQALRVVSRYKTPEKQIEHLTTKFPNANLNQIGRALSSARRQQTGKKRQSGSRPTFCAVATPVELEIMQGYADRHGVRKATAFHDAMALLEWLEKHNMTKDVLEQMRTGRDPKSIIAIS